MISFRASTVLVLIFAYQWVAFKPLWVCVNFAWNQERISKEWCVNRANPEKGCNGRCYLKNQLNAQSQDDQQPAHPIVGFESDFTPHLLPAHHSTLYFAPLAKVYGVHASGVQSIGYRSLVFQPPEGSLTT